MGNWGVVDVAVGATVGDAVGANVAATGATVGESVGRPIISGSSGPMTKLKITITPNRARTRELRESDLRGFEVFRLIAAIISRGIYFDWPFESAASLASRRLARQPTMRSVPFISRAMLGRSAHTCSTNVSNPKST